MKLTSVFVLLLLFSLQAQNIVVTATPTTSDVQTFMLSDFNFTGSGTSASQLFTLTLLNTTNEPQECQLAMQIYAINQGSLASGQTDPFTVDPGPANQRTITNRNLFSAAQQFSLQDYQINQAGSDLKNAILSTGRLPSDTYIFHFEIIQAGMVIEEEDIRFILDNPRTLDLISPGVVAGSDEDGLVYGAYPLFRWESDISTFRLIIAEQLPDARDDLSPEEVMQQRIVFEETFSVQSNMMPSASIVGKPLPSTMLQYPVGGARLLQAGKTYYWQMIGLVKSSGGPLEIPSEIWKFKVVGAEPGQNLTPLQQQILNLVRELDGSLLQPGGELNGFIPTEVVTKNGVHLKDDDIINTLANMVDGEIELLHQSVE
jgi:hypothetical protein